MSDTADRIEARQNAFERDTGIWPPGRDRPAAMGGVDAFDVAVQALTYWSKTKDAMAQRDSLALELAASQHNHKKDNTLLIGQRDALADACRGLLPMAEHGRTRTGPGHTCGPEGNCDCDCMAAAYDAETILQARAALAALPETPAKEAPR